MEIKKIISFILVTSIFLPIFVFAQLKTEIIKEKAPGILENLWNSTKVFLGKAKDIFFSKLKKAWDTAVMFWKKMLIWFKGIWNNYIWPKLEWLWRKISILFRRRKQ